MKKRFSVFNDEKFVMNKLKNRQIGIIPFGHDRRFSLSQISGSLSVKFIKKSYLCFTIK